MALFVSRTRFGTAPKNLFGAASEAALHFDYAGRVTRYAIPGCVTRFIVLPQIFQGGVASRTPSPQQYSENVKRLRYHGNAEHDHRNELVVWGWQEEVGGEHGKADSNHFDETSPS